MDDVIYFEDGDRVRKKVGNIDKIEDGLIYFIGVLRLKNYYENSLS